jgi:hypothetical protein
MLVACFSLKEVFGWITITICQQKSFKRTIKRFLPRRRRGSEHGDTDDEERAFRGNGVRVCEFYSAE